MTDRNGTLLTATSNPALTAIQRQLYPGVDGFPYVNKINGDAQFRLVNLQYNTAYDFDGVEAYSFGTYSRRIASAYENVRVPTRVSRTVAGVTTYFDSEGDSPVNGFSPREKIREQDMAFTGGVRGDASGFHYDPVVDLRAGQERDLYDRFGQRVALRGYRDHSDELLQRLLQVDRVRGQRRCHARI